MRGAIVGRWWVLIAGAIFGLWIWVEWSGLEAASWFLGLAYGAVAVASIAAGVFVRRRLARH